MYGSSMETGGHPEIYESDLLDQEQMSQYQMSIGSVQWDVLLGRYDFQYATNTMARFKQRTREVHMNRDFRMFVYLKHHLQANIHFYPQQINTEGIYFIYNNE